MLRLTMTIPEALLLLGHGYPGMRGKYLSQADRDEIAELIEGMAGREADDANSESFSTQDDSDAG